MCVYNCDPVTNPHKFAIEFCTNWHAACAMLAVVWPSDALPAGWGVGLETGFPAGTLVHSPAEPLATVNVHVYPVWQSVSCLHVVAVAVVLAMCLAMSIQSAVYHLFWLENKILVWSSGAG